QYRRSEESWAEAGRPTATVRVGWQRRALTIDCDIRKRGPLTFARSDAENHLDNEHADINGDGIQLYIDVPPGRSGWMLVPDAESTTGAVRSRMLEGWTTPRRLRARWERTHEGYRMRVRIELPEAAGHGEVGVDVLINEKPPGRDRRRAQLVLSGAEGEFVYLRGDRHDPERLLRFRIVT
ncbi:MAG TPA: hypothetical protein VJU87_07515, partial [Gemmatimonadaceae bacterium]|nr:hypothetical protein [Gemmatimonadaceae bacterium]